MSIEDTNPADLPTEDDIVAENQPVVDETITSFDQAETEDQADVYIAGEDESIPPGPYVEYVPQPDDATATEGDEYVEPSEDPTTDEDGDQGDVPQAPDAVEDDTEDEADDVPAAE